MTQDLSWLVPAIVTAAAAWGGVKQGMNGQAEAIERLSSVLDRVGQKVDVHAERIAVMEADRHYIKEKLRNISESKK
jgi:hypothetical protein